MSSAKRVKASEKQAICRKIVTILKKRYKQSIPQTDRPVLETMIYAICLENSRLDQADAAYQRCFSDFFDLNEVRVSSVSELETVFDGMAEPEWKALRLRSLLNQIFERYYRFEFEILRRKTLDQAQKELAKFEHMSPFVHLYTLQVILGAHLVPLDQRMLDAVIWLGLVELGATVDQGAAQMRQAIRKADVPIVCHYLRYLATDGNLQKVFTQKKRRPPKGGFDVLTAPERLIELFDHYDGLARKRKRRQQTTAKKKATRTGQTTVQRAVPSKRRKK